MMAAQGSVLGHWLPAQPCSPELPLGQGSGQEPAHGPVWGRGPQGLSVSWQEPPGTEAGTVTAVDE